MKNDKPKNSGNETLRIAGNVVLYGAAICTLFALIGSIFFWFFSIYFEAKYNSKNVDAIKEDLSYMRSDLSDLKKDVAVLKENVSVLPTLQEDVDAIKVKLNLAEQPTSF